MLCVAGIDIGSSFTKAVVITPAQHDGTPHVVGRAMVKTGVRLEEAARQVLDEAIVDAGVRSSDVVYVAATGFGRYTPTFRDIQITEITSGARGANYFFPKSPTVLDIGAQSTRAIAVTEAGRVKAFKTNDKCAAGSGSFIQRACKYLNVPLEKVGDLALDALNPQMISSVCAVLAESEIINHVSAGVAVEDILRGIYDSLADRASTLLRRAGLGSELTLIGGVARQRGMVLALEERLKVKVNVPPDCEYVCATGAAILGLTRLRNNQVAA